jgi:hypothetical protein
MDGCRTARPFVVDLDPSELGDGREADLVKGEVGRCTSPGVSGKDWPTASTLASRYCIRLCSAAISASNAFFVDVAAPGSLYVGSVRPLLQEDVREPMEGVVRGDDEPCARSRTIAVAAARVSSARDMASVMGRNATRPRDTCGRIWLSAQMWACGSNRSDGHQTQQGQKGGSATMSA